MLFYYTIDWMCSDCLHWGDLDAMGALSRRIKSRGFRSIARPLHNKMGSPLFSRTHRVTPLKGSTFKSPHFIWNHVDECILRVHLFYTEKKHEFFIIHTEKCNKIVITQGKKRRILFKINKKYQITFQWVNLITRENLNVIVIVSLASLVKCHQFWFGL